MKEILNNDTLLEGISSIIFSLHFSQDIKIIFSCPQNFFLPEIKSLVSVCIRKFYLWPIWLEFHWLFTSFGVSSGLLRQDLILKLTLDLVPFPSLLSSFYQFHLQNQFLNLDHMNYHIYPKLYSLIDWLVDHLHVCSYQTDLDIGTVQAVYSIVMSRIDCFVLRWQLHAH